MTGRTLIHWQAAPGCHGNTYIFVICLQCSLAHANDNSNHLGTASHTGCNHGDCDHGDCGHDDHVHTKETYLVLIQVQTEKRKMDRDKLVGLQRIRCELETPVEGTGA